MRFIKDIIFINNFIIILSSPICYINIKDNFSQKYIDKENILFSRFIINKTMNMLIYLNKDGEIKSFQIEINNNEINIIKELSSININNKFNDKID